MISSSRAVVGALVCAATLSGAAHAQSAGTLLSAPAPQTPVLSSYATDVPVSFALPRAMTGVGNLAGGLKGEALGRTNYGRGPGWARFASGTGNIIFLAAGTLLPLVEDGKNGGQHALRTADSLIVSTLITEGLKTVTHAKRPDGSDYKSFPSGHATAAFAVATMQAHYHPKQAILWYAGATVISASRVKLHRHYTRDVIAGAAVGFLTARLELNQGRGLLLRPFIHSEGARNRVSGLSVDGSF